MFAVTSAKTSRKLGESPSEEDLCSAVFQFGMKFNSKETVLVPRSRGGFVYGKIAKPIKKMGCYFDPSAKHSYVEWQVDYPDVNGRVLCKKQPSNLLGKIPEHLTAEKTAAPNQSRVLGSPASLRDLNNLSFNNLNKFSVGETVLIPRSSGGFTYGEILSPVQVSCLLPLHKEDRHLVNGWSVALDSKMKKTLVNGFIGKLPLCGAQLEVVPIVAPQETRKKRKPRAKKPKKGKSLTKRFAEMSSSLTPASEVGTMQLPDDSNLLAEEEFSDSDEEEEEEEESSEEILFKPANAASTNEDSDEEDEEDEEEILIAPQRGLITLPAPLPEAPSKVPTKKCPVVLDAPNIAMKHGKKTFSTKGIAICADYYIHRGHEVIAFLPEHYVSKKPQNGNSVTLAEYLPKVDNMKLIESLEKRGILFFTPPQDYDDSYCIKYARSNQGVIVTNDLYRDHIEKTEMNERGRTRYWIKRHCISFTFVKDQFLPNPDFKFPNHCAS